MNSSFCAAKIAHFFELSKYNFKKSDSKAAFSLNRDYFLNTKVRLLSQFEGRDEGCGDGALLSVVDKGEGIGSDEEVRVMGGPIT